MMKAVDAADIEALRQCIHIRGEVPIQRSAQEAVIACIVAQRALERETEKRWGAKGPAAIGGPTTFTPADYAAVAQAEVRLWRDRKSASVVISLSVAPIELRMRPVEDPQWRVVLRAIVGLHDEIGSQRRIDHLRDVARALRWVAAEVRAERLTTPDAARVALYEALAKSQQPQPAAGAAPGVGATSSNSAADSPLDLVPRR